MKESEGGGMNILLKWTIVFAVMMIAMDKSHAWNIGQKGRVTGPSIHTTYFLTPNNAMFLVSAKAYVGEYVNGNCQYTAIYDIGTENLKTGDFIDIDAFQLKSVIGGGYGCMSIYYTYKQLVIETFQLEWDGVNYNGTIPATAEVTIS